MATFNESYFFKLSNILKEFYTLFVPLVGKKLKIVKLSKDSTKKMRPNECYVQI